MLLGALLTLFASGPGAGTTDAYQHAVARALERAQGELVKTLDFEVDHSRWDDPWIVTTEHYEVRTTTSYAQTAELAHSLEFMRGEFIKLLGEDTRDSGKHKVWVFPTIGDYNQFGNQINAAEHSSMYGSFYAAQHAEHPVATYRNPNKTWLGMWVTHSAVHQFLEESFGTQAPVWVSEGLAGYFALYWDPSYGRSELKRYIDTKIYVPLERLVAEPLPAYAANPDERFIELGMMFEYLLKHCDETKNGKAGKAEPCVARTPRAPSSSRPSRKAQPCSRRTSRPSTSRSSERAFAGDAIRARARRIRVVTARDAVRCVFSVPRPEP